MASTAPTVARSAAQVFTTRSFRPLLAHGASPALDTIIVRLRSDLDLPQDCSNAEVVDAAYKVLAQSYRNEYVYKNLIASKIFVGRHRAANSVLLNEFAIGGSVADAVFVNGEATVYEIKTELDNPEKLIGQLADYYRAVPLVNVVVHETAVDRYAKQLEGTPAGLISVGQRWHLSGVKTAVATSEALCIRTMLNTLRVAEAQAALVRLGADVPDVPNGRRYDAYLQIAMQFEPSDFHAAWRAAIKARQLRGDVSFHRDPTLFPLRALLAQLDPTSVEGANLRAWLSIKG
ncbi:sce7726 family protein [Aeromicrobium fastidiosum]|uniref:Sce7726 family protein n=1 Tax=Aeromicrobium fastidiosum TaxID=52699 RepID=A0A641AQT1_9ACTN|nr:sce7726 family protein [Aeromicrobium fastidiosum]KAA1380464.1 sce7726 family protein [Aeromicrobium fastidiosum]MBP2390046.1 hypothetical protein [Aeromicrobium fastidiosum]